MSESRKATRVFSGLAVSEGVAIGHAVSILSRTVDIVRFPLQDDAIEGELSRFREAVARTHDTIEATHGKAGEFLSATSWRQSSPRTPCCWPTRRSSDSSNRGFARRGSTRSGLFTILLPS